MVVGRGQGGRRHRRPVVVLHVEHVGQQGLGGRVQLLHLALDCQGFQGDLLARPGHPQEPGDPPEEKKVRDRWKSNWSLRQGGSVHLNEKKCLY